LILWYFNPSVILPLFEFLLFATLYMLFILILCGVHLLSLGYGIRCYIAAWRLCNLLQISLINLICTNPNLFHNLAGWAYLQGLPCAASNTS
jgi:hypothetical protein